MYDKNLFFQIYITVRNHEVFANLMDDNIAIRNEKYNLF